MFSSRGMESNEIAINASRQEEVAIRMSQASKGRVIIE